MNGRWGRRRLARFWNVLNCFSVFSPHVGKPVRQLFVLLCMMPTAISCAQRQLHSEIEAGYGAASYFRVMHNGRPLTGISGNTDITLAGPVSNGVLYFGYQYLFAGTLSVGAGVSYEYLEGTIRSASAAGSWNRSATSFLCSFGLRYLEKRRLSLGSKVYTGLLYTSEEISMQHKLWGMIHTRGIRSGFSWQVVPVRIEMEKHHCGLFGELGWGYKGMLHAGIAFKW